MDRRERSQRFAFYVGQELKGTITSRGFKAAAVAREMGRSGTAFSNWLNGKGAILPLAVLAEACEVIGVEPAIVVAAAYTRLREELDGGSSFADVIRSLEDQRAKRIRPDIDVAADEEESRLDDEFGDGEAGDEVDGEPGDGV